MKQILRYPDYYITENAEIISKRCKKEKKLSQYIDKMGYFSVGLRSPNNKCKTERIHRLMIETYCNPPPDDMIDPTVDHVNGNKLDNRVNNLQWLSNRDNAYKHGKKYEKTYTIQNRNGEIIVIKNLNRWCKENNISNKNMRATYDNNFYCQGYKIVEKD